jgi:O-antigen/teichoic acid export membrane protein
MSSLERKTFKNVSYTAGARGVAIVFQAIANIILSRELLPSDYGLVGFASIFVTFFAQFSDLGLNSAVVQRKELDERAIYTGFTMKLGIGFMLYMIAFASSWFALLLLDNPDIVLIIKILALNFIFNCFGFLPITQIKRELNYKFIAYANVIQTAFSSTLAIILALNGFSYWSIVFSNIFGVLAFVIAINAFRPMKIRIIFDKATARQYLNYGTSLSLIGFIVFTMFNVDNFIIGAVSGVAVLGFYSIAFNWGSTVCDTLGAVINTVLFPTFSRMDQDRERVKAAYLRVLEYVGAMAFLVNITLLLVSEDFIVHVLGQGTDKWMPALVSFRILCVYGILRALLEPVANVFMALDLNKVMLRITLLSTLLQLIFIYPAIIYCGIEGVSMLVTTTYFLQFLFYYKTINREIGVKIRELVKSVQYSACTAIIVVAIYMAFNRFFSVGSLIDVFILSAVITFSYIIIYGIISNWRILREIKSLMTNATA